MLAYRVTERFNGSGWVPCEVPEPGVRCWDAGSGPLWIYRDSLGIVGFVRARTWEEAWECCKDAVLPDADPALVMGCIDLVVDSGDLIDPSSGELPEGFGWRPNGAGTNGLREPVYCEDLNGSDLSPASARVLRALGYRVSLVD